MKNDRMRISIDDAYVIALGRMAYGFAVLEWNAVWCCERMQATYINNLRRKTAGTIAADLVRLAAAIPDSAVRAKCLNPAQEFKRLVDIRNGILHGKPGTDPAGEQRLFRDGHPWTPTMIDDAADEFTACSNLLNALLYAELAT